MLEEALSYPRDDEDLTRPFLIGSVLLLTSFLVGITIIPLYGYLLKVLDAGRTGTRGLPEFDDWEELVIDGLKVFVVNLLYTGIPAIIFSVVLAVLFFFLFLGGIVGQESGTGAAGAFVLVVLVVGGLVALVAFALSLVAAALLPAALARMQVEDDFSAVLEVREVFRVAKNGDYLVAIVLAWVVGFGFTLVGGLLSLVLIGIPIILYGMMVTFHLYGQGYARAVESMERRAASVRDEP